MIETIGKVHPLFKIIRENINKRSTMTDLGKSENGEDWVDWQGYVVCNKDTPIVYSGKLKQKQIVFKKNVPTNVGIGLLWKLVLRSAQEGPDVRVNDDNPNKWNEGKPRVEKGEPLELEVFDDFPENHLKRSKSKT